MNYNHFNEDYQRPVNLSKSKIDQSKKHPIIKNQFKLSDKAKDTLFSSYINHKLKKNRDSNCIMNNLTIKNPLAKAMLRQSSAGSKQNLLKECGNFMPKTNPSQLINHKKNRSTIIIENNQINQSTEMVNKTKIVLKKTEAFSHISKKETQKPHSNLDTLIKKITANYSRSRSKLNLDQTNTTTTALTKTSSDPATTTSKRLINDHILKTSAHKMYIDNFKNSIIKNLSSSLMTQLKKKKQPPQENSSAFNCSNIQLTEVNGLSNMPIQYMNTDIEELEPITLDTQEPLNEPKATKKPRNIPKQINSNQPSSGTLISEESLFESKPQSNSNTHNNSFSFKQVSNKPSSNSSINLNDKKSLGSGSQSLSKSNSGQNIEQTVSLTYSDEQITEQKSRKRSAIDQEDFKAFTEKINARLKHI